MTKHKQVLHITFCGSMASALFILTYFFKVQIAGNGYWDVTDVVLMYFALVYRRIYIFIPVGIGYGMADFASGFPMYIPATLIIRFSAILLIWCVCKDTKVTILKTVIIYISFQIFMVLFYALWDYSVMFHGSTSIIVQNMLLNTIQACIVIAVGIPVSYFLLRNKFSEHLSNNFNVQKQK